MRVVCDIPRKHPDYEKQWRLKSRELVMLAGARNRAKNKGLEYNLTKEDIEIPEYCPILGIKLQYNPHGSGFYNDSPSLDRIDPSKGYIKGNVRVISNRANLLKSNATIEELEKVLLDARLLRH